MLQNVHGLFSSNLKSQGVLQEKDKTSLDAENVSGWAENWTTQHGDKCICQALPLASQCVSSMSVINFLCHRKCFCNFLCTKHVRTLFKGVLFTPQNFSGTVTDVSFKAGWACLIHFPMSAFPGGSGIRTAVFEPWFLPPQLPCSCCNQMGFFETFIRAVHEILSQYCWNIEIFTCAIGFLLFATSRWSSCVAL